MKDLVISEQNLWEPPANFRVSSGILIKILHWGVVYGRIKNQGFEIDFYVKILDAIFINFAMIFLNPCRLFFINLKIFEYNSFLNFSQKDQQQQTTFKLLIQRTSNIFI